MDASYSKYFLTVFRETPKALVAFVMKQDRLYQSEFDLFLSEATRNENVAEEKK